MASCSGQPSSPHSDNGQELDLTDPESVAEYIKAKQAKYEECDLMDSDLWEQFKEDFTDFTEQIFKDYDQLTIRKLRSFLRTRGTNTAKDKYITVARSLARIIQEEDQAPWSIKEI
jgi:hypothetical protein